MLSSLRKVILSKVAELDGPPVEQRVFEVDVPAVM